MSSKADFPTRTALQEAAIRLGCDIAAIEAVASVEAGAEGAFLDTGEPVILFERHVFYRLVKKEHGEAAAEMWHRAVPDVCGPEPGSYGPVSRQHARLRVATKLDRELALRSASWGLFQVLGDNCERCGMSLQELINAAYRSADEHLRLFVALIEADRRLVQALKGHDWPAFARRYNGPAYARNHYDTRLAAAYKGLAEAR